MKKTLFSVFFLLAALIFYANSYSQIISDEKSEVLGFGILKRVPGLWNGPVSSATPAGNFDSWFVDFRPVSEGQISQYSRLDSHTLNFISFFIVKHDNQLKVAMRTEGCFDKQCCVTYEVIDSVDEQAGYYRFSDFQKGTKRAFTEFQFEKDKFLMEVYTNKFNKVSPLELHTRWKATLGDKQAAQPAITHFNYPQAVMIKDFSTVFNGKSESIYFSMDEDPYPSSEEPYTGTATINIKISEDLKVKKKYELFVLLTTQSLFEGLKYNSENNKYFSKYLYLPIDTKTYTIKNVHPGKYFVYSFVDVNNDKLHKKKDYMSSDLNNIIEVPPNGIVSVESIIDFVIP